jgi:hypothetical protein
VADEEEHVQRLHIDRVDHEKVCGPDALELVAQERSPALTSLPGSDHAIDSDVSIGC